MPEKLKEYRPANFVSNTSYTGSEAPLVLRGQNMILKTGRFGSIFAKGYSGNLDLGETITTKVLTGNLTWTSGSKDINGTGTAFNTELRPGNMVLLTDGSGKFSQLAVVERIRSNTSFICARAPDRTYSGGSGQGDILPVLFPVGNQRGTAVMGNVIQFPKGHYLGVGEGTFNLNGSALSSTLALSKTPRFAVYDPSANTYTQVDVGIAKPQVPITLAASAASDKTITAATAASPIVCTTAGNHNLYTGQRITIRNGAGLTGINGEFVVTKLTDTTFSLDGSTGTGVYTASSATIDAQTSMMRAGAYSVRVCRKNTQTLGYSNPSDAQSPVTLVAGQWIKITFNEAMITGQDAYDVYVSQFQDSGVATVMPEYNGPWYLLTTITKDMLKTTATPLGTETATVFYIAYSDAEVVSSLKILSFDNFEPKEAEFVDIINGIPIYFSCLGKGNTAKLQGTSPGPCAIPSKPSNPEAVFLNKAFTTAGSDYILGEFNAKSRIYVLCQNSLQTIILTAVDEEPITFRSLWNCGFKNPYNVTFVKEYLYGFSSQKIVRSVAGGDNSAIEFEFANDVHDYVENWEVGHVLVAYDPKNRMVCYFYTAGGKDGDYWYTIVLPFLIDQQIWNPPIILKKDDQDFIVSGAAVINDQLVFLAGGLVGGNITMNTYVFDGGDSDQKDWYLAWNYSDDGDELQGKGIRGFTVTGQFADVGTKIDLYGVAPDGIFDLTNLYAGTSPDESLTIGTLASNIHRSRFKTTDWSNYFLYSLRMSGSFTDTPDRLDSIIAKVQNNSIEY